MTGSGFLVPPVDGRTIKAATFSAAKWDWVRRPGATSGDARARSGGHREEQVLQLGDEELVQHRPGATSAMPSASRSAPIESHVQRWGGVLPQYAVGHLDRVAAVRDQLDGLPGLAVCGSPYDGVGTRPASPWPTSRWRKIVADLTTAAVPPDGLRD